MHRRAWKSIGIAVALACAVAALGATSARADAYTLTKVVLSGDPAPGSGGTFNPAFFALSLNEAHQLAFTTQLTVGENLSFGVFAYRGGSLEAVALRGDPVPDSVDEIYAYVGGASPLNDAGDVSFTASLMRCDPDCSSTGLGIFLDSEGVDSPAILAGEVSPAPTPPPPPPPLPSTYDPSLSELDWHGLANSGAVAFVSSLLDAVALSGVFVRTATTETIVALEGGSAPPGGNYSVFRHLGGSPSGHVVFVADVTGGSSAGGIFRYDGATGSSIALLGASAPGAEPGTFSTFLYPAVNASGDVVFMAAVVGSTMEGGIFVHSGGELRPVAFPDDPAPGTSGGTITSLPSPPVIAGTGDVVFPVGISGGSVAGAVYRYSAASQSLSPVVRAGRTAPGTGGERFVSFGSVAANSAGQVAFEATLSDGRVGVFLASPMPVPSFGISGLTALALLFAGSGLLWLRLQARSG
jgi:hypothetical protein